MIHERRGTMYDPDLVDAFLRIVQRLRSGSERERASRPQARTHALWQFQARAI
jgi:HD-GYP domain-containing protein (c-di-GMP phosphodiesterase class II)